VLFCLRVQGKGSRWLQFECLRGLEFVLGDVSKRKPFREGEERLSDSTVQFQFQFQFGREGRASC
jgi:hypothetical protein